jgi:hypothetical membrane protein
MIARQISWAAARYALVVALLTWGVSIMLYPGGTVLDESTHGYSFTHNFLSDLGSTVAFNYTRNLPGAVLFAAGILIGVSVLAGTFVGTIRLLSTEPRARLFARLAAAAGTFVCLGYLGAALTPLDQAFRLHLLSSMVASRSFPLAALLLAIATARDRRFRARATIGWITLTLVLVGAIVVAHLGPSPSTEGGLMTQVITQKIMVVTALVVLWLESLEAEVVNGKDIGGRVKVKGSVV